MKKLISTIVVALIFVVTISKAQTAMQLSGNDCNGNPHDLFADLDAGKAVILHFFMPNCGSCPPPAQKIQAMANNILATYPGMITAYAMPFNNSTTCTYTSSWVSDNGLSLYAPFDSGAVQVAHYGGFGMPTVVLLGGINHDVLFSTQSFSTSDTTEMKDLILDLLGESSGINELPNTISSFNVFPNPSSVVFSVSVDLKENSILTIDITNLEGKIVAKLLNEKQNGLVTKEFDVSTLPSGNYLVQLQANGKKVVRKLNIIH